MNLIISRFETRNNRIVGVMFVVCYGCEIHSDSFWFEDAKDLQQQLKKFCEKTGWEVFEKKFGHETIHQALCGTCVERKKAKDSFDLPTILEKLAAIRETEGTEKENLVNSLVQFINLVVEEAANECDPGIVESLYDLQISDTGQRLTAPFRKKELGIYQSCYYNKNIREFIEYLLSLDPREDRVIMHAFKLQGDSSINDSQFYVSLSLRAN